MPQTREQHLIALIKDWSEESLIGDDCAVLPQGSIVTSDMLVEGTHFRLDYTSLTDLGYKAMAVNLSDIAAMGGRPKFAFVNIGFPSTMASQDFRSLMLSMIGCAKKFRTRIAGGDLTASDNLVISITIIGDTHDLGCLRRSGAQPGDLIICTGSFGGSALGLKYLQKQSRQGQEAKPETPAIQHCLMKHRRPEPRLAEAWALVRSVGSRGALMDASDGLADALIQIATASGVGLEVDAEKIPYPAGFKESALRLELDPLELALYGGEDYELVATLSERSWQQLKDLNEFAFKTIGVVTDSNEVLIRKPSGEKATVSLSKTFQHWN